MKIVKIDLVQIQEIYDNYLVNDFIVDEVKPFDEIERMYLDNKYEGYALKNMTCSTMGSYACLVFSDKEAAINYINERFKTLNKIIHEEQTLEDMQKEYMLLGLRKIEGINIQKFKNKFAQNPIFIFKEQLNKLVDEELIIVDGNEIKLTNKGLDLANIVWEEFV